MTGAARWRKRRRGSSASLFILVQIQAGPPAFAAPQLRPGKPAPTKVFGWQASPDEPCHAAAQRTKTGNCRLMGLQSPFAVAESGLKTTPRARATWRLAQGTRGARPFFVPDSLSVRLDAQKNRHLHHPDHRRRSHRDREGLRIRLFGHLGGQDAEGGGL